MTLPNYVLSTLTVTNIENIKYSQTSLCMQLTKQKHRIAYCVVIWNIFLLYFNKNYSYSSLIKHKGRDPDYLWAKFDSWNSPAGGRNIPTENLLWKFRIQDILNTRESSIEKLMAITSIQVPSMNHPLFLKFFHQQKKLCHSG